MTMQPNHRRADHFCRAVVGTLEDEIHIRVDFPGGPGGLMSVATVSRIRRLRRRP